MGSEQSHGHATSGRILELTTYHESQLAENLDPAMHTLIQHAENIMSKHSQVQRL